MSWTCDVCGETYGVMTGKYKIADGTVCQYCWKKAGYKSSDYSIFSAKKYSLKDVREKIDIKEKSKDLIENFKPTLKFEKISFDDVSQTLIIKRSRKNYDLFYYDQIVGFELLEDGESVSSGGLGTAIVGGALFGGVGAVVGGVTGRRKNKRVCNSLKLQITFRNSPWNTVYISYIDYQTKTNGPVYKSYIQEAYDTMAALQLAIEMTQKNNETTTQPDSSDADELLKFKQLLDMGAITEEEFETKKKQILGL